jgi:signal transduction histidine kinase
MKRTTTRRATTPGGQFVGTPGMSAGRNAAHSGHSALLELALHGLHYAVLAMDADGRVSFYNVALERLLGLRKGEIQQGAFPRAFLPEPILATVESLVAGSMDGAGEQRAEIEYESPQAGKTVLEVRAVRLGGTQPPSVGTVVSIQEFSAVRSEARAHQLDEAKTNFLSLVSHELRTPLTAMKGSVHLLRESGEKYGFENTPELVRVLEKNTDRLVRLVGNLLDLVHLQNDSMTINRQRHNLRDIADAALAQCAEDAAARRLEFETDLMDLYAPVDRDRIGQALGNVLLNAIRFSKEDSQIRVSIEHRGEVGRLRVSDTTEGLAAQARRRLFAGGKSGNLVEACTVDGSGIGMVVSQSLVELHGGTLYAEERAGGSGVDFVIELPIAALPADA